MIDLEKERICKIKAENRILHTVTLTVNRI